MDKSILDRLPRDEWERLIQQHVFDEQARYMLQRCMLDGLTYQAVAEEIDTAIPMAERRLWCINHSQ